MRRMRDWKPFAVAACILGASLAACGPDVSFGDSLAGGAGEAPFEQADAGTITGDGAPSSTPMLVKIDPGASMVQTPGQGVGVFTQYDPTSTADPGGHWYIWWTCDTNTSGEPCAFDISVSVAHGEITDATPQGFGETDLLSGGGSGTDGGAGSASLTAQTTTTSTVQGVHFNTDPGAVITLSASLGGDYSGSFLFFVEDGKVNGGYRGMLHDPLELQPSSP